jgi:hypothetical protein
MKEFAANGHADPGFWTPAKLITKLANEGGTFDENAVKSVRASKTRKKGGRRG